jgi:hypothetical protein
MREGTEDLGNMVVVGKKETVLVKINSDRVLNIHVMMAEFEMLSEICR